MGHNVVVQASDWWRYCAEGQMKGRCMLGFLVWLRDSG